MNKTTVYLQEGLKLPLRRMAGASGRFEADLIRDAITALTRTATKPRPCGHLFASGDPFLAEHAEEMLSGFGDR